MEDSLVPGKKLIAALAENGFREISRGDIDMMTYYTNEVTLTQVRINYSSRTISFINSKGICVREEEETTYRQIKNFNKEGK